MSHPDALRIISVHPCCHACHSEGFVRSGFDATEPYVIYSNLRSLPAKARREFVDALVAGAEGDVVLLVSAPVPAEFRNTENEEADGNATSVPVDPDDPPTAEELDALIGTAGVGGTH